MRKPIFTALSLLGAALGSAGAQSLCEDFNVPAGHIGNVRGCEFDDLGTTTISLDAPAILNWNQFRVNSGQRLRFISPDGGAHAVLNRDLSSGTSRISGSLVSDGRLLLVNPGGSIAIDEGGLIEAGGGFFGTTLQPSDEDALLQNSGQVSFSGGDFTAIDNRGTIQANSGDVTLLSGSINNFGTGRITAANGRVDIAAATEATYSPAEDSRITIIGGDGFSTIINQGTIRARDSVSLSAHRSSAVSPDDTDPSISNLGIIRTTGPNGEVFLRAPGGQVLNADNAQIESTAVLVGAQFINRGNVVIPSDGSNPAAPSGSRQFPSLTGSQLASTPTSDFRLSRLSFNHLTGLDANKQPKPKVSTSQQPAKVAVRGASSRSTSTPKPAKKPAPKKIMLRRGAFFGKKTG